MFPNAVKNIDVIMMIFELVVCFMLKGNLSPLIISMVRYNFSLFIPQTKKHLMVALVIGARGEIRTPDHLVRR
jgi:hypothetical protein